VSLRYNSSCADLAKISINLVVPSTYYFLVGGVVVWWEENMRPWRSREKTSSLETCFFLLAFRPRRAFFQRGNRAIAAHDGTQKSFRWKPQDQGLVEDCDVVTVHTFVHSCIMALIRGEWFHDDSILLLFIPFFLIRIEYVQGL
jgi:hypothetical protein